MKQSQPFSESQKSVFLKQIADLLDEDGMTAIRIKQHKLELLDQRTLPEQEIWLPCDTVQQMWTYIKRLSTRGAPLIGCSAALSLAVHALNAYPEDAHIVHQAEYLKTSRPTAVNLMYACDLISQTNTTHPDYSAQNICKIAHDIVKREIVMCNAMSTHGAALIRDGENILTHCNTGSLATVGAGTALGVIKMAHSQGKKIHVYVDETRPLLQGGRLTAYELKKKGIPYTIICDNMAAMLMKKGLINRVLVGADRIALNGDFANKIGTYSLAVIAHHHGVPFHPVAPLSTVDFECKCGDDIPIEERPIEEVHGAFGTKWAPSGSPAYNPAFDVTPADLVTTWILDTGVYTKHQIQHDSVLYKLKQSFQKKNSKL